MVIGIIGTLVGLMILGAGIYYLIKEKIYNVYDRIGIAIICIAMIVTAIGSVIRDRVTA